MKLIPVLLLNVAIVAGALVVYDQMRRGSDSPAVGGEGVIIDRAALEERIEALEAEQRPALRGAPTDARVLERLDALEEAVRAEAESGGPRSAAQTTEGAPQGDPDPASEAPREADPPTEAEIHRFRRLQAAARRQERMEKVAARVDKTLDGLALSLSERQRARIATAYSEFQPRVGQIWSDIKTQAEETMTGGGTIDRKALVQQGMAQIQQEFAEALDGIVAPADAEVIAEAIHPGRK